MATNSFFFFPPTILDPFVILSSSALLRIKLQQQGPANCLELFIQGGDKWYFHIVELISASECSR